MIASLSGMVLALGPSHVVLDVGGVGYKVFVPANVQENLVLDRTASLHTHLIVREDALTLFGFMDEQDRAVFELLLGVSGVGPKVALAILSAVSPEALRTAVAESRPELLGRVSGVGKKTAEKIIFHLKDRLGAPARGAGAAATHERDDELLAVLTSLGYSLAEAHGAVQALPKDAPPEIEERLRLALQRFAS